MLSPVKEGITPFPEAGNPTLVLEFVQSKVTPETELVSYSEQVLAKVAEIK